MGRPGGGAFRAACHNPTMRRRVHHEIALAVVGRPGHGLRLDRNPSATPTQPASVGPVGRSRRRPPGRPAPTLEQRPDLQPRSRRPVQQIRELTKKSDVARKILTPEQLTAVVTDSFDKSNPPALVAANEELVQDARPAAGRTRRSRTSTSSSCRARLPACTTRTRRRWTSSRSRASSARSSRSRTPTSSTMPSRTRTSGSTSSVSTTRATRIGRSPACRCPRATRRS